MGMMVATPPVEALVTTGSWTPMEAMKPRFEPMKSGVKALIRDQCTSLNRTMSELKLKPEDFFAALRPRDFADELEEAMNETSVGEALYVNLEKKEDDQPWVCEIFTTSGRVKKEAERRGHPVGPSFSKDFGLAQLRKLKPKLVVLAFPCTH